MHRHLLNLVAPTALLAPFPAPFWPRTPSRVRFKRRRVDGDPLAFQQPTIRTQAQHLRQTAGGVQIDQSVSTSKLRSFEIFRLISPFRVARVSCRPSPRSENALTTDPLPPPKSCSAFLPPYREPLYPDVSVPFLRRSGQLRPASKQIPPAWLAQPEFLNSPVRKTA